MDKNDYYNESVLEETLKNRNNIITERWKELSEFYLKYSDEMIKHLFYVNAGGSATIIGFMGASESIRNLISLRIALCFFAFGLICVGILRAILVLKIRSLFDNWRKDAEKYWNNQIGYSELVKNDDNRSESDHISVMFGFISGISCIVGMLIGGVSLFSY